MCSPDAPKGQQCETHRTRVSAQVLKDLFLIICHVLYFKKLALELPFPFRQISTSFSTNGSFIFDNSTPFSLSLSPACFPLAILFPDAQGCRLPSSDRRKLFWSEPFCHRLLFRCICESDLVLHTALLRHWAFVGPFSHAKLIQDGFRCCRRLSEPRRTLWWLCAGPGMGRGVCGLLRLGESLEGCVGCASEVALGNGVSHTVESTRDRAWNCDWHQGGGGSFSPPFCFLRLPRSRFLLPEFVDKLTTKFNCKK